MAHDRAELVEVIRDVRNRWRRRLAARGAVIVLGGTMLALLLSASGLETLRFSPPAVVAFRVIIVAIFAALGVYAFVKPLRRRVSDTQVALYLEEANPQLETAILSAVDATAVDAGRAAHSPRLAEKLVEQAIEQCRVIDQRQSADHAAFKRHAAAFGAVIVAVAALIALGPAFLRHGIEALVVLSRSAEASSPYHIQVRPGNAKVPRGGDQSVHATLQGFKAKDVAVLVRTAPGASFERVPLAASADPAVFDGMLFHLDAQTEYLVEANGIRSESFHLDVVDLPTVKQMDLEYHYPAYTNLAPRKVDGGGDVAALRGTDVSLHIVPTMTTSGGQILLKDGAASPLAVQPDGSLSGRFRIDTPGFYRIELTGPHGEKVDASPQFTIDVLDDQPPTVSFTKPGRDTSANPVEEVFTEVRAVDDFGVKALQLVYSVNGGPPKTVSLFGGGKALPEVSAGHTLYLEELGLKPGDFVSYYAVATDNDTAPAAQVTQSDIYFVQVRPFKKDYKPATSGAQGGGGGAQGDVGDLSRQQREIVAATFNTLRDKARTKADKYRENVVFLNLAQAKLRTQVEELVQKIQARLGAQSGEAFKDIAEALPKAATEMRQAENELKAMKPDTALAPEQRALKILQEAEQKYEEEVSAQNGGGGSGSQSAMADDLADLFELELDKLANQYEMQQRADQQQGDHQIDQLSEKLKELARRQQQEAERQRRMAQQGQSQPSSGGGGGQRQLAEELQQAARQLQQLSRDEQRPDLADAARQLQQAADQMRQAAANGAQDGGAQANAALEKLQDAQRRLQQNQSGRAQRDIQSALKQAQSLAEEQKEVLDQVSQLDASSPSGQGKAQALGQRKDAMDAKVADLQKQLEQLGNETRKDERDASRRIDDAAATIRDKKVREKIQYTKRALQPGAQSEYAKGIEEDLGANFEALQKKIGDAAAAMGQGSKPDALGRAADQAKNLVRGMESLNQRLQQQKPQDRQGQQGQQNQQGQQAGQKGQPGQAGQQGQQGQQGQGGQGQQGQQGQGQQGQGQAGQSGSQGQQGQNGQNQGGSSMGGSFMPGGGASGDARPQGQGRYSSNDIRQYRREYQEMQRDAQQLRQELQRAGINAGELDEAMRGIQGLADSEKGYADPKGLQMLQADALDRLKKFEFALRRKMDAGHETLSLSGSDEVPAGFRQAIEEYYRSLAKKQSK